MNCRALSMENRFQVAKFLFEVQKLLVFFVWFKMAQGSLWLHVLASESVLSGPSGVQSPFRGLFGPFVTPAKHSQSKLHAWNSKENDQLLC